MYRPALFIDVSMLPGVQGYHLCVYIEQKRARAPRSNDLLRSRLAASGACNDDIGRHDSCRGILTKLAHKMYAVHDASP